MTPAVSRRRRSADAPIQADVLRCPRCGGRMTAQDEGLRCSRGHRYKALGGFFDLWPPDVPVPRLDWFSGPYGLAYDTAIKERPMARFWGRLGWGADIDRMYRMMDDGVKTTAGEVVLDVPVGGAPALRAAAGRLRGTYIGVDLSRAMLRRAHAERVSEGLENVVLVRGDITHLPVRDASVDRALCFNGLHVLADKRAALEELHRVLKPGGVLRGNVVIANPSLLRPWFGRSWLFFHPADPAELERLARDAGLRWQAERQGSMLFFEAERARVRSRRG